MNQCPICSSEAAALDRTGDADGFDCPGHGRFKVSSTVFVDLRTKHATLEQWESALAKAKQKAAGMNESPVITTYDFPMWALHINDEAVRPPLEGYIREFNSRDAALAAAYETTTRQPHMKPVLIEGPEGKQVDRREIEAWCRAEHARRSSKN